VLYVWVVGSALGWWFGGVIASMGGGWGWVCGRSGISKASKILLGYIVWHHLGDCFFCCKLCVNVVSFSGIEVCSFVLAL